MISQKTLNKLATVLLKPNVIVHKKPTKADLNKKFVMLLDRKGNPTIKEV